MNDQSVTPYDEAADKLWKSWLTNCTWSWQDGQHKTTAEGWDRAWARAEEYRRRDGLERVEFLRSYQRVLDEATPPQVELVARLEIGQALVVAFTPFRDQEGLAWYVQLVERFNNQEWRGHRCLMVAKLHLAGLLHRHSDTRVLFGTKIQSLYQEVLEVPENEIVFDSESTKRLNLEEIVRAELPGSKKGVSSPILDQMMAKARADYQSRLLQERKEEIDALRRSAARSFAYKQWNSMSPQATRNRLVEMKAARPQDVVYVSALDEVIQRVDKVIAAGAKHGIHELEDETIRSLH